MGTATWSPYQISRTLIRTSTPTPLRHATERSVLITISYGTCVQSGMNSSFARRTDVSEVVGTDASSSTACPVLTHAA
eukprot:3640241-Rhodomonas_salina.1